MRLPDTRSLNKGDSIVPLINIVFLLLVFFLLAGTLSPRPPFEMETVSTELAPPAGAPADAVFVSAEGRIAYHGVELSVDALTARLAEEGRGSGDDPVEVQLDRRLLAQDLFPILEALSRARLDKLRLVTEREAGR